MTRKQDQKRILKKGRKPGIRDIGGRSKASDLRILSRSEWRVYLLFWAVCLGFMFAIGIDYLEWRGYYTFVIDWIAQYK